MTVLILVIYAVYKFEVLTNLMDYSIHEALIESVYDIDDEFSLEDGFTLAAAITEYDGSSESIERPDMGHIEIYMK